MICSYGYQLSSAVFTYDPVNNSREFIKVFTGFLLFFRINEILFLIYFNRLVGDFELSELKNLNWIHSVFLTILIN